MQAKRYYRYASIRDDILRKLRLETPPNVTSHRLPAIPQLQSIIEEMCQQKGASCAETLTGDSANSRQATSRPADNSMPANDDDNDVRATTIKILLFPTARNSSVRCFLPLLLTVISLIAKFVNYRSTQSTRSRFSRFCLSSLVMCAWVSYGPCA